MVDTQVARQHVRSNYLKTLAHPVRLEIIEYLREGEKYVGDIVSYISIGQSNVSRHLAALKNAGVLNSRQEGSNVYYSVGDERVFRVLRLVNTILKSNLTDRASLFRKGP